MKQLKKTILTLVALLAVTTGAWAQADVTWTYADIYSDLSTKLEAGQAFVKDGIKVEMKIYPNLSPLVEITADNFNVYGGAGYFEFTAPEGKKFSKILLNGGDCYCQWNVAAQISGAPATWEGTEPAAVVTTDPEQTGHDFMLGSPTTFEFYFASAPSGPEVAWDNDKKTGTFTMPGGNVELEPEYYPQAVLATGGAPTAINDVPATTDGAIVNAGTVANIGSTANAQGTVMYYVSTTALDDAALLALAADAWTADVPTAQSFTAAGTAHVYYYVRGNDSDTDEEIFSDGDILAANALTVTIAAEPTYAVTFAKGIDEPTEWTASPNTNVTKGETVTVTYTGSKKVIGVKAEKKAEAPHLVIEDKNNFFGIGNQKFYFTEGETWTEAMANHPENAAAGWVLNGRLRFKPDVYGNAVFVLRSDYKIIEEDIFNQPIDSSKTYSFSGTKPT